MTAPNVSPNIAVGSEESSTGSQVTEEFRSTKTTTRNEGQPPPSQPGEDHAQSTRLDNAQARTTDDGGNSTGSYDVTGSESSSGKDDAGTAESTRQHETTRDDGKETTRTAEDSTQENTQGNAQHVTFDVTKDSQSTMAPINDSRTDTNDTQYDVTARSESSALSTHDPTASDVSRLPKKADDPNKIGTGNANCGENATGIML